MVDIGTGELTGTGVVPDSSSIDVSPDGTRIVYVAWGGGPASTPVVNVANVDGSNEQSFDATEGAQGPRWSPDGNTIVYQGKPDRTFEIGNLYILNVSTGKTTQITDLKQVSANLWWMGPTLSPDGKTVLFTMPFGSGSTQRWDLWSAPVSGGEPTLVKENAIAGDYSPDGKSIVYSEAMNVDGGFMTGDLYIARPDGSGARKLVEGRVGFARWSPDGTKLVYGNRGLTVLDVETGEARKILDYDNSFVDWVDNDTVILEMGD